MTVRVVSTPLHGPELAQSVIRGAPDNRWFASQPSSPAEWKSRIALVRDSLVRPDWLETLSPAFAASGKSRERLEAASRSGFAITAGQQPGLFGGPLYTWWKALSAVALADRLQEVTGVASVPIFWAATDDSDFAEASSTVVSTADGAEIISLAARDIDGTPLGQVPVGDLTEQLSVLFRAAGSGSNSSVLEAVESCYRSGETIGGSYVRLLRTLLEPLGVAVLDASHPAVQDAALPVLKAAVSRAEAVQQSLEARANDLRAEGHAPQVKLVKGRTLVFSDAGGKRDRIRIDNADDAFSESGRVRLGPNVLLRPIVERSILPAVAYMGGPSEIAYFAQVTAVARAMDVPAPLVVPRWSGFVIEARVDRILQRYNLDVDDFRDPHSVESRIAKDSMPPDTAAKLTSLREAVEKAVGDVSASQGSDLVSPRILEGLRRNVAHRIERLERRFAAGIKRRGNEALRDIRIARGALFPFGKQQERTLNIIPLLARHGDDLVSAVMKETRAHAEELA